MTGTERLSSLDAAFLNLENDRQQMHVGSLLLFEAPAPTFEELRDHLESCLDQMPRHRQRVRHSPLDLARPIWVDDPHFSLSYHLRHTAIPAPGGDEQLRSLMGRVMSQRLDVDRPLWEVWLVEGLPNGQWAIITKTHHAMVDGLAGSEVLEHMLDRDPHQKRRPPTEWSPRPGPSRRELAVSAAGWAIRVPGELGRACVAAVRSLADPGEGLRPAAVRAVGLAEAGRTATRPTSVLNGPTGPHRRWGWARGDLATVKAIKEVAGCTVNDVILAAIAGGFRTYLAGRGEPVDDLVLRSLVPVSVRTEEHRGRLGNQVTAVLAELPVAVADPVERLAAAAQEMDHLKGSGMAVGIEAMMSAADFVPATLMTLGARVYARTGQRVVNAVTTNVPGPPFPLFLQGCRMLDLFPYIPIAEDVRISIGIVSYNGRLGFGVTGDYDAVPDLDALCLAIEEALAELAEAVAAS